MRARYFDGRNSRAQPVQLAVAGDALELRFDDPATPPQRVPLAAVGWPERTRHGSRVARLPGGASVQAADAAAWDAWVSAHAGAGQRHGNGPVVRLQQSWRGTLVALVLLAGTLAAGYHLGLPAAARLAVDAVPQRIDAAIGRQALAALDQQLLAPSKLPADEQARWREALRAALARATPPETPAPPWRLEFRSGRTPALGPNALALPGGTIVLTDELVALLPGDGDAVLGVLGHEWGHVRHRHGMRQLVQASAIGLGVGIAFGDYGSLIGTAPVLLATLGYSRRHEREADAEALAVLRANRIAPAVMVRAFEALDKAARARRGDGPDGWGIAFSSHPATAERIAFFRDAAR